MLFNYLVSLLLIILKLIIAKHHRAIISNHDNIISLSSILGSSLIFNNEIFDKSIDNKDFKIISWYKGLNNLKFLINSHNIIENFNLSIQSHYYLLNQTKLFIKETIIGDEGFYILKIQIKTNIYKQYLYHVILFSQNLSFYLSPSYNPKIPYYAEQKINFTCSISLFADHIYIEQFNSLYFSMIIYNNDPDYYQLLFSTINSYIYIAYLFNYELNRNDHNQIVSCTLIQENIQRNFFLHNISLNNKLNIEYKTYLRGNYYFIRSFNSYSTIEINCEEFDGNPKPVYTLIWILNNEKQILLNKTIFGRYFIENATWKHRGNYTCYAENYLNNHQPVYQSFRLNIWFNTNQLKSSKNFPLQLNSSLNKNQSIILIILIIIFISSCFFCILSFYYFCLQMK